MLPTGYGTQIAGHVNGHAALAAEVRAAPNNIEVEQALLGAILVDNKAIAGIDPSLTHLHFFDPLHGRIFQVMAALIQDGRKATPVTMSTYFETAQPINAKMTVPQYLGTLAARATTTINAPEYARTILELALRRQLIVIGEDMLTSAYEADVHAPPGGQIDRVQGQLRALRSRCETAPLFSARCLADVKAEHIRWLWPERMALGKLSIIAGLPGLGKSQLTLAMVAAVTTGGCWPDGSIAPRGSAILITCEDEAADTIRPRLEAAGADLKHVDLYDWTVRPDQPDGATRQNFDIKHDVDALAELIRRRGDFRIVIIDPVTAYMGRADSHKVADVRSALAPLQGLAAETGVAVILVSHLNKSSSEGLAINRVSGSGAFVAVCRSAWLVAADPKDADKKRRILCPLKNNIGDDRTGFAFRTESAELTSGIMTSRVAFEPVVVVVEADELLRPRTENDEGRTALGDACDFLRTELADGAKPAKFVEDKAEKAGVSSHTLRRARQKVCETSKTKFGWTWQLLDEGTSE